MKTCFCIFTALLKNEKITNVIFYFFRSKQKQLLDNKISDCQYNLRYIEGDKDEWERQGLTCVIHFDQFRN